MDIELLQQALKIAEFKPISQFSESDAVLGSSYVLTNSANSYVDYKEGIYTGFKDSDEEDTVIFNRADADLIVEIIKKDNGYQSIIYCDRKLNDANDILDFDLYCITYSDCIGEHGRVYVQPLSEQPKI